MHDVQIIIAKLMRFVVILLLILASAGVKACPEVHIYLQPYGDFTQKEAKAVAKQLDSYVSETYAAYIKVVRILPNRALPKTAYYKPRKRYLANKLLADLPQQKSPVYIIGLTHKDISYRIHGYANYGIMGLTPLGVYRSVVSDYRVKDKEFVKMIIHEIGHGVFGAGHCSDSNCIMCDYSYHKGKPFVLKVCKNHMYMQ